MSLQLLKSDIESHNFRKLYYICGEEAYLKHYYFNELKSAIFGKDNSCPDCLVKDASDITISELSDAVSSFPIFSEKKAIVLKDLKGSDEAAEWIIDNIDGVDATSVFIIYQITEKMDMKLSSSKYFKKTVLDYGLWVEINPLDQQTLNKWVNQQFRKRNKKIDSQTLSYFISSTSSDMYSLSNEIAKLSAYCDEIINKDAIDLITSKTIDAKTYEFTNAIFDKNSDKAFSLLKKLLDMKTNEVLILSSLYYSVIGMYKTKILYDSGYSVAEISEEIGQKPFVIEKNVYKARRINMATLKRMIDLCCDADILSKSTTVNMSALLSDTVVSLIGLL